MSDQAATLKQILLTAPDTQLDVSMVEKVKLWSEPAQPLEVLEVLDLSVHGGLASGFVIHILEIEFESTLARFGVTREEVIRDATWRDHEPV